MPTTRIVAVSDTHGYHEQVALPPGDVLVHGGDFSKAGTLDEFEAFLAWFVRQPHPRKVFVAGNHDLALERDLEACAALVPPSITFLHDSEAVLAGLRFWGAPWTPLFHDWAFMDLRGEALRARWDKVPAGIDVLLTHGPPYGHGDLAPVNRMLSPHRRVVGCLELLAAVKRVRPRVHLFGHIHGGYGTSVSDEVHPTVFANAATCTEQYAPTNPPLVLDVRTGE